MPQFLLKCVDHLQRCKTSTPPPWASKTIVGICAWFWTWTLTWFSCLWSWMTLLFEIYTNTSTCSSCFVQNHSSMVSPFLRFRPLRRRLLCQFPPGGAKETTLDDCLRKWKEREVLEEMVPWSKRKEPTGKGSELIEYLYRFKFLHFGFLCREPRTPPSKLEKTSLTRWSGSNLTWGVYG